jgi:TetR/AcrR family transcriptional regulator
MGPIGADAEACPRIHKRDRDVTVPAILAAAEIEFATNGFAAARTESIACKEGLYEAVLVRAYQPLSDALDKAFDKDLSATDALLAFVERLLAAMTEHPLSPIIFMLESIQGGGQHFRKLGMPSLYCRVESLLKKGIASGEFREMDSAHGAVNIIGLCGFYFCAANNISQIPGRSSKPLSKQSLARHTAEVMAFVRKGTAPNS